MREPSLPSNTCPAIDDVQDAINKAIDAANDAAHQLNGQVRELEDLRSANASIREYGEYWKSQYDELLIASDEMQSEINRLEEQVEDLKSELKEIERYIPT